MRFVQLRKRNALRGHHVGEDADAAQIMCDRTLRVALVEKMPPELVQVISKKIGCDVVVVLACRTRVGVHFWLLRFEEAQLRKRAVARATPDAAILC